MSFQIVVSPKLEEFVTVLPTVLGRPLPLVIDECGNPRRRIASPSGASIASMLKEVSVVKRGARLDPRFVFSLMSASELVDGCPIEGSDAA